MRIERPDNLMVALIHRNRAALARGCRPESMEKQVETKVSSAARILLVPPVDCAPPDAEAVDRITPADWPYVNPLKAPRADQPYEPHRIPQARNVASQSKPTVPMTDLWKGQILDVFA